MTTPQKFIPIKFGCRGNAPDHTWSPDRVMAEWRGKHLYEVAFLDDKDAPMVFGDVDVHVADTLTTDEFRALDETYQQALTEFLGTEPYALATASSYEAHKISWRFYLPGKVGTSSAQREWVKTINKDDAIRLPNGTPVHLDEGVYHPYRKMRMLYAWKQTKKSDGTLEDNINKWEKRPLRLVHGREEETLLHNVNPGCPFLPEPKPRKEKVALAYEDFDLIRTLVLEVLDEERAGEYVKWRNVIWAIKGVEDSPRGLELAQDFSRRSSFYDPVSVERMWKQGKGKMTGGSIRHWAKSDNPIKFGQTTSSVPIEFLETNVNEGDQGMANIFVKVYSETLVSVPSPTRRSYFTYNSATGLWTEQKDDYIITKFTTRMKDVLTPLAIKLAGEYKDMAGDGEAEKKQKKRIEGMLNLIRQTTNSKTASRCLPQIYTLLMKDETWVANLNANPDILPVANGVLMLETGEVRPYELTDYITAKLSYPYNPEADTSKQERFFREVLHNEKDAMDFIQYWFGYCLTGRTDRQQFLVLEGTPDGANAKSVMIESIGGVLEQFFSTLDRKALAKTNSSNNDSLYNARYSRLAVVNELNKNSNDIDEGLVKSLTGNEHISVSAKYKNEVVYAPQFKFVCPLNDMFPIPASAGALWRRVIVFPTPVRFLNPENPQYDEDLAKAGFILPKDDKFVEELKADKVGWLAWLTKGAMKYYEHPTKEVPPYLNQHILRKQEENDPHLKYIRATFTATGKDEDFVPVVELSAGFQAPPDEKEGQTSRRIAIVMKKLNVRKSTRDIYPRKWSRDYNSATGTWDEGEKEDRTQKARSTKVWVGLRRKTEEEKEAEREAEE